MVELVIKIPEDAYKLLKNEGVDWLGAEHILNAVANGTPLPENHGRLIDADAFILKLEEMSKKQKYKELPINDFLTVDDVFKAVAESLQNEGLAEGDTPTIIEADKESEEV
jgi:hypothetical protein